MALMALATGVAQVTEMVFENRFMHVAERRAPERNSTPSNRGPCSLVWILAPMR